MGGYRNGEGQPQPMACTHTVSATLFSVPRRLGVDTHRAKNKQKQKQTPDTQIAACTITPGEVDAKGDSTVYNL